MSAGIVGGRALSSWPSLRDDIVHAGAVWRDEPVVRDRNWVSSRGPQDFAEFVPAMIDLFAGRSAPPAGARDSSPARDEPIPAATRAARWMPGPAVSALAGALATLGIALFALRRLA